MIKNMEYRKDRSLVENLLKYGNKKAIVQYTDYISYIELASMIETIGKNMRNMRFSSVAIHIPDKMHVMMVALSCMNVGIPFIVLDWNNPKAFNEKILSEAETTEVIYEGDIDLDSINTIHLNQLMNPSDSVQETIIDTNERVLFYIATSGSTGNPKVAERYLSAFIRDYFEMKDKFPYLFNQVAQQYAKLNFSYGLENSILLLLGGTTICFSQKTMGVNDIDEMLFEIENNQATVVFWATPIIKLFSKHFRLCEQIPDCVEYIYTGGEPLVVSADLVVIFKNKGITLINDYGCSELGKLFSNPFHRELKDLETYNVVGVGKPLKGYETLVLDEAGNEVEEGYLYLKSDSRFPCSYVNKSIITNEKKMKNYWIYNTQDIARKIDDEIIILGREINSVNVSGYRIELEQVEYLINTLKEIEVCVVLPHLNKYKETKLYCFYVGSIEKTNIRDKLIDIVPLYMIPTAFFKVEEVFLLPNGKVDRKRNATAFEKGMQEKSHDETVLSERIYKYLVKVIGMEVGNLKDIYSVPFSDYGFDSLMFVDFISTIEEKERVKINTDVAAQKLKCLKDIVEWVNDSCL